MSSSTVVEAPRSSRVQWIALASAWFVALAVLLVWLLETPQSALRHQLKAAQFWSLEASVALGLAIGAIILRELQRQLERRDVITITMLAALALGLTLCIPPRTNRIYYDEQIYQGIGQNLADLKLAQMCNDGSVEYGRLRCFRGEYNKQPYGYPHLLSLAYRVFGVGARTAFAVNAVAMAMTVCLLYLLVFALFSDRPAALFAALLLMLTPEQVIWSATEAAEPSASLACVVSLFAAAWFLRSRTTAALAGAGIAAAYAVQFRPESLLILPVVGLMFWLRAREELTRPRLWWVGLLFLALVAVHAGHTIAVRNEGWGTTQARLSLSYVSGNLRTNGWFYLADARFPATFTLLAALGLIGQRERAMRTVMGLYFVLFFGICLLFYAGSYDYGADIRYSLATYPSLAILGGLGVARLALWMDRVVPSAPTLPALTAALAFQFLSYMPLVRATGDEAWAARADVRFAQSVVPELRGNSFVLTHNPSMFHVWGVNAGQMSTAVTEPSYLPSLAARYAGGVYLHWNYWCNVDDRVQPVFCAKVLALGPVETIRDYRERGQHYVLYRLVLSRQKK